MFIAGAADFFERVAAYADDGSGQNGADLSRSEFAGSGGEMDAVSSSREGDVGAAVDQNLGEGRGRDSLNDATGEGDLGGGGKMLLPQEKEGQASAGKPGAAGNQGFGMWVVFAGWKPDSSVSDGILEHYQSVIERVRRFADMCYVGKDGRKRLTSRCEGSASTKESAQRV